MNEQHPVRFVNPDKLAPTFGYTHVVETTSRRTVYVSGQVAFGEQGQLIGDGDLAAQTRQVFENIAAALEAVGMTFRDVVKLTFFMTDISGMPVVREIRDQFIDTTQPPASSAVEVRRLIREELMIEIEAIAAGS
ncbi:RidA family protein [Paenibacillus humicus]|uniref:RidA family protein n=1 Tax=Paenibacillus humicus TaxID=412861 RepID=UPI003F15CD68